MNVPTNYTDTTSQTEDVVKSLSLEPPILSLDILKSLFYLLRGQQVDVPVLEVAPKNLDTHVRERFFEDPEAV